MTIAVITDLARSTLEGNLPDWIEPRYFSTSEELLELAPQAEIGWFDAFGQGSMPEAVRRAEKLRWLTTVAAGIDHLPLDLMAERGVVLTNGAGHHAGTIAEYAIMGMLSFAKGYREIVRAQDRREWLFEPPGKGELAGSRALIVGAGAIGGRVAELLRAFDVEVTEVRRHAMAGCLGPDEWRPRLGEFDWVLVAVPSTAETGRMFGAAEFAAMRNSAVILNFARGTVLDQDALMAALDAGELGGAFLDVTDPEPLPADHPLWTYPQVQISMHLSGRSQTIIMQRGAKRFLDNLQRWNAGDPLEHRVDLALGY